MKHKIFILFLVIWFFRGFISEYIYGLSPAENYDNEPAILKILLELPILLLFFLSFPGVRSIKRHLFLIIPIVLYVFASVLSAYFNHVHFIDSFKYSRFIIYSLFLYFFAYNALNNPKRIHNSVIVIFILAVLQILASLINYAVYGPVENRIGTLALMWGSLATIFPLTIISFIASYYFVVSRKTKWLILSLLFLLIGLASGKRALIITIPFFFLIFLVLSYRYNIISPGILIRKAVPTLLMGLIIALPVFYYYLISVDFGQATSAKKISLLDQVVHVINYAKEREQSLNIGGLSRGRIRSSKIILSSVLEGEIGIFGNGPMTLYDEEARGYGSGYTPLGILYGIVGWGRDVLSIGVFSVFFVCWYIAGLIRKSLSVVKRKAEIPKILKFINLGCLFASIVFLYDYLFYSASSFISGYPLFLIAIGAGAVHNQVDKARSKPVFKKIPSQI